jgi:hypothetical protein
MKKNDCRRPSSPFFVSCVASSLLLASLWSQVWATNRAAVIEARIADDVKYLASDELAGRGVGTPGIDLAAEHIAEAFRDVGLKTDLFDGTPFQRFEIPAGVELGPTKKNRLVLIGPPSGDETPGERAELVLGDDFTPLAIGANADFDAPVVFVGYGVSDKQRKYDDYAGIDVNGKIVLMLRNEPPREPGVIGKLIGTRPSRHATFQAKVANAAKRGAAAVIIVNDGPQLTVRADELPPIQAAGPRRMNQKMPVVFAKRDAFHDALKRVTGKDLLGLEAEIAAGPSPKSVELGGWRAMGKTLIEAKQVRVKNVVGVLDGEGPNAEETIVIGAHYDHLGFGGHGSRQPNQRAIHNGADDNASGVAVLIEIARDLARREKRLGRRVVFIAFSAEEWGLLGSRHYVDNPLFPIDETVAMLNLDMVGRLKGDQLWITGIATGQEFAETVDEINEEHGFKIGGIPRGYGGSDHAPFQRKNVPAVHVLTGLHGDFHKPTDDFEKTNVPGMRRIAAIVGDFAESIAEAERRPTFQAPSNTGGRPKLGIMPDNDADVRGVRVASMTSGGAAAKAGMKNGDVIVKLGDAKITSLSELLGVLIKQKPGGKIACVVQREGKEVELTLTFGK